jgi:hemerythrin superfamily protein
MDKKLIACMKDMISTSGPDCLTESPFRVYKELGKIKGSERKLNGAIFSKFYSRENEQEWNALKKRLERIPGRGLYL